MHLPTIYGTERQIVWAEKIRRKVIVAMSLPGTWLDEAFRDRLLDRLLEETDAAWWITQREELGCSYTSARATLDTQNTIAAATISGKLGISLTPRVRVPLSPVEAAFVSFLADYDRAGSV